MKQHLSAYLTGNREMHKIPTSELLYEWGALHWEVKEQERHPPRSSSISELFIYEAEIARRELLDAQKAYLSSGTAATKAMNAKWLKTAHATFRRLSNAW